VVYVIHAADGNIPSDMATRNANEIEEERRLFYVALTRAKNWLYVCYPLRYYWPGRSGHHSFAQRTRFLPNTLLDRFEPCVPDPFEEDAVDEPVRHTMSRAVRRHTRTYGIRAVGYASAWQQPVERSRLRFIRATLR